MNLIASLTKKGSQSMRKYSCPGKKQRGRPSAKKKRAKEKAAKTLSHGTKLIAKVTKMEGRGQEDKER